MTFTILRPETDLRLILDCLETDLREKDEYSELKNTFHRTNEQRFAFLDLLTEAKRTNTILIGVPTPISRTWYLLIGVGAPISRGTCPY